MKVISSVILLAASFCCQEAAIVSQQHKRVERTCGYDGCPKPKSDMLNVHIVPHTHDDAGWRRTVDQYFYGTKMKLHKASVRTILDSVIKTLLSDPEKRFIYVESVYFFKWWNLQTDELKSQVKQLVNEGRLEFVGGSWTMNDGAVAHYQSIIDQFTLGLGKLNDTFGECGRPKIAWQIDPFSHSREFAFLVTQMGYDGFFIGRIDYEDKINRIKNRNLEMVWHTGANADIFTGVLYNLYHPPPGFCFDVLCDDDLIVDDINTPEYNLDKKLEAFFEFIEKQSSVMRTNNIILTMGRDFTYMNADYYFSNLDRLIKHIDKRQRNGLKVNAFYSTPSCYLKALHDQTGITWPTKNDDFVPTASTPHEYWTGYFSSRPTLKRFERVSNQYLQICKQLTVLTKNKVSNSQKNIDHLREAMGIIQHHDATSGAVRPYIVNDYARLLQIGIDKCSENIEESLNQLIIDNGNNSGISRHEGVGLDFKSCADLNISSCEISENSHRFMVTLYNPLGHSTHQYVRIPVRNGKFEVFDHKNGSMTYVLVPIPSDVRRLSNRENDTVFELVFFATDLPPLGYKSYFLERKSNLATVKSEVPAKIQDEFITTDANGPFTIGNQYLNLTFDVNGLLESAATEEVQMKVRQNFYFSYTFRPNGTQASQIVAKANVRLIRNKLVDEVHQTFNSWLSQVIRIYKAENYAELHWVVGPIDVDHEIITKFDTDIKSNGVFFTDSNGRQTMKRKLNHRDTWNLTLSEPTASNYYPIQSKIAIEDNTRRFAILTDRSQGGSSLKDGSIELMVHRRLSIDESPTFGKTSNDMAGNGRAARGTHYFVFGSKKIATKASTEANERFIQRQMFLSSWLFFSNMRHLSYDLWRKSYENTFSGMSISFPKNVNLLTCEPLGPNSILIRFEHIFEENEDKFYSRPVSFNLRNVFTTFDVTSIRETTLAANQWLEESKRLSFSTETSDANKINTEREIDAKPNDDDFEISLKPMEIRTFIVEFEWRT
ncbi:lysosomal alpha-mannosidase-like [Sitodiplosis mosellana]|uniref:lysosomal alpha-mannosidase-like n=1 Tax=Sitodiplosis mosellana TaxID=263140 RepID=UPI0024442E8D|nr:lysosomal alpha-mannosidase-like [Sitodiplosis mosellana]